MAGSIYFFRQDLQDRQDFFRLWRGALRPKDRGKMEDHSAMTRDDRTNDLKHRPFSLSPSENGGSSTLNFQLFDLYPPYPDDPVQFSLRDENPFLFVPYFLRFYNKFFTFT